MVFNDTKQQLFILINLLCLSWCSAQNSWQEYTFKADSLQLKFNFEKAYELRLKAIEIAKTTQKDTLDFLSLLGGMSKSEVDIKDPILKAEAYQNLQNQIIRLEEFNAKPERLYQAYRRLYIFAHNYIRNMADTDDYISKSIEYHLKSKAIDSTTLLRTLHSSGVISREVGRLQSSIETFKNAEEFYGHLKVKDTNMLGSIYLDLAMVYDYKFLNIPTKRLAYLKKSESIFKSVKNPNLDYLVGVYMSLSEQEKSRGDYDESIGYINKAIQLYNDNKSESQKFRMGDIGLKRQLQFHSFLIEIYWKIQDEEQMHYHFDKMLKINSEQQLDDIETDFLTSAYILVSKFYHRKDNEKALKYVNEGLAIHKTVRFENYEHEFNIEKIKIYLDQGRYNDAEDLIKTLEETENLPLFVQKDIMVLGASLYSKLGNEVKAFAYINRLIHDFSDNNGDVLDLNPNDFEPSLVLNDTNRLLSIVDDLQNATFKNNDIIHKLYQLALKQFESNFDQDYLNEALNDSYSQICMYFYNKGSEGKLTSTEKSSFINFTETIESKYLRNTFLENRLASNTETVHSLVNEEQLIRSNITYLKKKNLKQKSDSLVQLIFEENLKLKNLNEELKGENLNVFTNIYTSNSLDKLNDFKDAFVIKYKVIDNTLFSTLFHNGDIQFHKIDNYTNLKSKIENVVIQLKDITASVKDIKVSLSDLHKELIPSLNFQSEGNLIIIPDGILHYLPFELLISKKDYLLNDADISYASSISLLDSPVDKNGSEKIALFAPSYSLFKPNNDQLVIRGEPYYLEGAKKEVASISKLFKKSEIFESNEASKDNFKSLSNEYSILHLAMHSFINDEDSELSSLVFTDKNKDYELYISELYGLNLNADLAVLSACNTGVGELKTGKGIVSMNTAFTAAGVPSVLSSLWSAPDAATEQIMKAFYKNLKQGYSKSKALKKAKQTYLNNTEDPLLKHPFYWAGFVISGDTSPIIEKKNSSAIWIALGGVIFCVLGFAMMKTSKKQAA